MTGTAAGAQNLTNDQSPASVTAQHESVGRQIQFGLTQSLHARHRSVILIPPSNYGITRMSRVSRSIRLDAALWRALDRARWISSRSGRYCSANALIRNSAHAPSCRGHAGPGAGVNRASACGARAKQANDTPRRLAQAPGRPSRACRRGRAARHTRTGCCRDTTLETRAAREPHLHRGMVTPDCGGSPGNCPRHGRGLPWPEPGCARRQLAVLQRWRHP